MASKHICPKCGCREFVTSILITQDVVVDDTGNFIAVSQDCTCVVEGANDGNLWTCLHCGEDAVIISENI